MDDFTSDWSELTFTDSWNLPAVYEHGARELLARALVRIAKEHSAVARDLRRAAKELRSEQ